MECKYFVHLLQTAAVVNELIGLLCSQSEKMSMCVYVYVPVFVWCCVNNLFKNIQGKHKIIQMCLSVLCDKLYFKHTWGNEITP